MHVSFKPEEKPTREVYNLLTGCIGPRPIALVATMGDKGVNLAPFSFFNVFSVRPPVVAFSPLRRMRDGSMKHTCENLTKNRQCTIQVVTHDMVEQVNLCSGEFAEGVDEFVKSGLTPVASHCVAPPRVAESPFHMECQLLQMVALGSEGGAGNLAICEVLEFHVDESVISHGVVDADAIDLVGRMGGDHYVRASGQGLFLLPKVALTNCIGYEGLPVYMKHSEIYSANNLARFAACDRMPGKGDVNNFIKKSLQQPCTDAPITRNVFMRHYNKGNYKHLLKYAVQVQGVQNMPRKTALEMTAKAALANGNMPFAWNVAVYAGIT